MSIAEVQTTIRRDLTSGLQATTDRSAVLAVDWTALAEFLAEVTERTAKIGADPHVTIVFGKRHTGEDYASISASWTVHESPKTVEEA
jgi:hypothetical protein